MSDFSDDQGQQDSSSVWSSASNLWDSATSTVQSAASSVGDTVSNAFGGTDSAAGAVDANAASTDSDSGGKSMWQSFKEQFLPKNLGGTGGSLFDDPKPAAADQTPSAPEVSHNPNVPERTPERIAQDQKELAESHAREDAAFKDYRDSTYPQMVQRYMDARRAAQSDPSVKVPPMPEDPITRRQRGGF